MASYRGHLSLSSILGAAVGAGAVYYLHLQDWGVIFLGAGLTAVGGLLPDLDSDSGVPVRELFGLLAVFVPLLLFRRLHQQLGLSPEQTLVVMAGTYVAIRYGVSALFKHLTVHRGMFHSVPAMLIAGLGVYLLHHGGDLVERVYLAGGMMLGFLSHLILDEIWAIDFNGLKVRFNKYAGSALKFWSSSATATLATYALLIGLGYLAWREWDGAGPPPTAHAAVAAPVR